MSLGDGRVTARRKRKILAGFMLEYKTQRSNKTNSTDDALHDKSGNKKQTQSDGVCGLPVIINQKYQKSGEEK